MTGRFGQAGAHFVIVGFAADEPVNEATKGCLCSWAGRLPLHLLCRLSYNLLRRCCVNALHRDVATTLMQDQGSCLSLRIGNEGDLCVDDFGEKLGIAMSIDRDCALS